MTEDKEHLFESMRAKPHISHAQIETYLTCPLKYRFQYVDKIEWKKVPAALSFGSAIHEALGIFYQTLKSGFRMDLPEILTTFEKCWKFETDTREVAFKPKEDVDEILELGKSMLEVFYEKSKPRNILAIEEPFSVNLKNFETGEVIEIPLIGKIDLIEQDNQGNIVIVDAKTASRRYSDSKLEDDLQMTCYAYHAAMNGFSYGDAEILLRFDVLLKTKEPDFIQYFTVRDENDCLFLFKLVKEILKGIRAGVFYPNKDWYCPDCPYSNECRNW